jgi:drug/metabolite transporter (DMT)-like permease
MGLKSIKSINKKTISASFFIGLSLFLGSGLQLLGLLYTTPSKSGFLTGLNVIIVPILIVIVYKKIPEVKTIIGAILSIVGLGFMSFDGNFLLNPGDLLTILCAVCFAFQIILVDIYCDECNIYLLTALEMTFVGILGLFPAIYIEHMQIIINTTSIASILFLAIFCTVYAYFLQNKVQKFTDPTHTAIIFLAEPVFGAIFSVFLGDKLGGSTLLGCIIIFIGMVIININWRIDNILKSFMEKFI